MHSWIRGLTTNVARLDPAQRDPLLQPARLSRSIEDVARHIEQWASHTQNWSVKSCESDGDTIRLHLCRTTRLFRFVDDLHVTLHSDDSATELNAESRSRVGKGDLGQNRRNLRELMRVVSAGAD